MRFCASIRTRVSARFEDPWLLAAWLTGPRGRFCLIYPVYRQLKLYYSLLLVAVNGKARSGALANTPMDRVARVHPEWTNSTCRLTPILLVALFLPRCCASARVRVLIHKRRIPCRKGNIRYPSIPSIVLAQVKWRHFHNFVASSNSIVC